MKKLFGEGGFVGFLARHCEKIVFGLAVLIVIWVALPNSEHAPVDESQKGPTVLTEKVKRARDHLQTESWPTIYEKRYPKEDNFLPRSRNDLKRVALAGYRAEVPLDKPNFPLDRLREDPRIYPVENLQVAVTTGGVAIKDPDARDVRGGRGGAAAAGENVRAYPPEVAEYVGQFNAEAPGGAKVVSRHIVSITGLVPVRKQRSEYEAVLSETAGYQDTRDTMPVYGAYEGEEEGTYGRDYYLVERAEVMPDGTIGEFMPGWGKLQKYKLGSRTANYVESQWAGGMSGRGDARGGGGSSDFPDPRYVDTRFAMNVPPVLLRDLSKLANHPKIPRAGEADEEETETEGSEDPEFGLGDPLAGGARRPARGEESTRPGTPRRGEEGFDGGRMSAEDVDYLLFRFFDMEAEPGKAYVYRVKVLIEDPNFPQDPAARPARRTLAPDVIARLDRRRNKSLWWRESEYSENSPVAFVPRPEKVLVGPVDPGKVARPPGRDFGIRQAERTAKVMAVVWDEEQALDVPGVVDAARGTVVNFTADVEAIDPVAHGLRKIEGMKFATNNTVLDVRGGDWFTNKKNQAVPGEVLMMDEQGRLVVHSELEDAESFGNLTFPPPPEDDADAPPPGEGEAPEGRRPPRGGGEVDIFGG